MGLSFLTPMLLGGAALSVGATVDEPCDGESADPIAARYVDPAAQRFEQAESPPDLLVAATGDDEDNIVICQLARERYGVPKVIARVNDPRNHPYFDLLGIKDAHRRSACRHESGVEPWACSTCTCTDCGAVHL